LTAHSDKEGSEPTWKRGYDFTPDALLRRSDRRSAGRRAAPRNAGADQITVAEAALAQIPEQHIKDIKLLLRIDSAGACHELIDWCRNTKIDYSVGVDLTEGVRDAIAKIPGQDWVCSLDQDGAERPNGQVAVLDPRSAHAPISRIATAVDRRSPASTTNHF